jgi:hypothetical protein
MRACAGEEKQREREMERERWCDSYSKREGLKSGGREWRAEDGWLWIRRKEALLALNFLSACPSATLVV